MTVADEAEVGAFDLLRARPANLGDLRGRNPRRDRAADETVPQDAGRAVRHFSSLQSRSPVALEPIDLAREPEDLPDDLQRPVSGPRRQSRGPRAQLAVRDSIYALVFELLAEPHGSLFDRPEGVRGGDVRRQVGVDQLAERWDV